MRDIREHLLTFVHNCFVNDMSWKLNANNKADSGSMAAIKFSINKLFTRLRIELTSERTRLT